MSLFGALSSGVSGLTAQSSAMGAISDNITNINTIGYKNTKVNFQTLVTKQTSATFYSAGGVQSKPRQATDVQGLLQASTSQTDIAIAGKGFFVVNEANEPGNSDQFLYTRSGSFYQDNQGYLKNTSGYFLQGWPTDANGKVKPANTSLTVANKNIVSTDYLASVNLNRVGGTASSTTKISIGANLPSSDSTGTTHKTDIQFFDTLGTANTMSVVYTQMNRSNQWSMTIEPPPNTAVLTMEDNTPTTALVYKSTGQLQFNIPTAAGDANRRPADGATVVIDGTTYEFDTDGSTTATKAVNVSSNTTLSADVASLVAAIKAQDMDYANYGDGPVTNNRVVVSAGSSTTIMFQDQGTGAITVDPTGLLDSTGTAVTTQTASFTAKKQDLAYTDATQLLFSTSTLPSNGDTITINSITYTFSTSETGAALNDGDKTVFTSTTANAANLKTLLADLEDAIEAKDPSFSVNGTRVETRDTGGTTATNVNTLVLKSLSSGSYTVDASGLTGLSLTQPDGTAFTSASAIPVNTAAGIQFNSSGLPSAFNVGKLEITDYANGAADMDDAAVNAKKITLDFGTVGEANGMTQFGSSYTPVFITQNGSRFGTFAGVSVNTSGLMTALFDNGETRPIYQLPVATFVNPNGLEGRTGNVWNATEASGDYTLRTPDNGPAGQTIQSALEASTVDIGEEFTNMIVVQRAYSASAKIISTTDAMLEELMRVKR
jgi:flagellar hook protein FlgE